jgi:hypothetical protein
VKAPIVSAVALDETARAINESRRAVVWPNYQPGTERVRPHAAVGGPALVGYTTPGGRFVAVTLAEPGDLFATAWRLALQEAGAIVVVARSPDEAVRALGAALEGT